MKRTVDPVVREFDVVIVHPKRGANMAANAPPRPRRNAYIIQYPTRIKYLAQQPVGNVTFHPVHERLETKVGTIAEHTDPTSAFKGIHETTFRSRRVPMRAQYAVGTVSGKRLVLRPVNAVLQMQPAFDYIDNCLLYTSPSPRDRG